MCFLAWLFKVTNKISRLKGCLTVTTHLHCVLGLIVTEIVGTPAIFPVCTTQETKLVLSYKWKHQIQVLNIVQYIFRTYLKDIRTSMKVVQCLDRQCWAHSPYFDNYLLMGLWFSGRVHQKDHYRPWMCFWSTTKFPQCVLPIQSHW